MVLVQLGMSFQSGSYQPMIEVSSRFGGGHFQVQHPDYEHDPRVEHCLKDVHRLRNHLNNISDVVATSIRTESFGVINFGENSVGAMLVGVDPDLESDVSYFSSSMVEGEYVTEGTAAIGSILARNASVGVGDEIVILTSDVQGGVAALTPTISGIFRVGNDTIDRSLVHLDIGILNETLLLSDSAHRVVIMTNNPMTLDPTRTRIEQSLPNDAKLYDWQELMPEVSQNIRLDKISNAIVYSTLTLIVVLSIANTSVMTIIERTRELGVLRAMGMRDNQVFAMLLSESTLMWIVGVTLGSIVSTAAIIFLAHMGIGLEGGVMEEISGQLFLPDRIFPSVDTKVVLVAPISIGLGVLTFTAIATIRLFLMPIIKAMRYRE